MWSVAIAADSYRRASEDRAVAVRTPFGWLLAVADGVGGRSGGAAAADAVIAAVRDWAGRLVAPPSPRECVAWLRAVDAGMSAANGETTAVVAAVSAAGVTGAAVGDSAAWRISPTAVDRLTTAAGAKPWVGSGAAKPVGFASAGAVGRLLLATDGLTKYAVADRIAAAVRTGPLADVPAALLGLVRPASGRLPDDVVVIVAGPGGAMPEVVRTRCL